MSNFIKFYHFNTKESRDNTEIDDTSISFCKEDMSIETQSFLKQLMHTGHTFLISVKIIQICT